MTGEITGSESQPTGLLAGRYRIQGRLGQGGIGVVYDAVDERLGRRVAIKLLRPDRFDEEVLARFQREALAAGALQHPNIVQVSDFQRTDDGSAFLVMEHLQGQTLSGLMSVTGPLPAGRVVHITRQLLDALGAAHAAGLIHRDVKPANVFLVSTGGVHDLVKLLDFGTVKTTGPGHVDNHLTMSAVVVGTPAYMAPEQASGREVTPATDIYAVGVLMYCALTARRPFDASGYNAMIAAILMEEPPPLSALRPDLDPGIVAIVQKAMAKAPEHRYRSAAEMRAALAPFELEASGQGFAAGAVSGGWATPSAVSATGSTAPAPAATPARPRGSSTKLIVGGAVAAAVALAVVVGVFLGLAGTPSGGAQASGSTTSGQPPAPAPLMHPLDPTPAEPPQPTPPETTPPVQTTTPEEAGGGNTTDEPGATPAPEEHARPTKQRPPDGPDRAPPGTPAPAPASDRDRQAIQAVARRAAGNCTTELMPGQSVRSTLTVVVGGDGHQQSASFAPPVPDGVARCVFMYSMQTEFDPRPHSVRIPIRITRTD